MVTLKAFYCRWLNVRGHVIMYAGNYLRLQQSEKIKSVAYHSTFEVIENMGAYLVHMLRWILSRLDDAV